VSYRDPDYTKKYYQANKPRHYWNQVRRLYGMEKKQVIDLFIKQNTVCPICMRQIKFKLGKFCIDHNHETGKVRGILHKGCNTALGLMHDSTERMLHAIEYIARSPK
jgi:hypothetical protein